MKSESDSFEEGFKIKMKEYRRLLAAERRYDLLMAQYNELQEAAMKVIETTNEILDTEPWPRKFRAPYGALVHLQKVLTKGCGLRLRGNPNLPQEGQTS